MKRIFYILLVMITPVIIIDSCKHDAIDLVPGATVSGDCSLVCFESDILPVLQNKCATAGCHDAASHQGDIILDNYAHIYTYKAVTPFESGNSKLFKVLFETGNKRMPPLPGTALSQEQVTLIGRWIDQGAKNTINCAEPCDTTQFKYAANIVPILTTHCYTDKCTTQPCHSGTAPKAGIDLTVYINVKLNILNGRMMDAITHNITNGVAPMPNLSVKLKDCQITQIRKWKEAGAPNN